MRGSFHVEKWRIIANLYDIALVQSLTSAHYQTGMEERRIGLIKRGMEELSRRNTIGWPDSVLLSMTVAAKNLTPISQYNPPPLRNFVWPNGLTGTAG